MRKFVLTLIGAICIMLNASAQNRTVTGKVTDEKGAPVEGVSITTQDNKYGTKTDKEGHYTISLPSSAKTLTFTSVNFDPFTKLIGSLTSINVTLKASDGKLGEVVVTGYGRQKKANITSAQSKVGGDKVENVPFASVDQILQGKVAGLNSVTNSGQPGSTQQIRIRGIGSISASAQPLFVVDGIQVNTGDLSRTNTTANTLAGINPDDIERIDVLKDASATAIYGSRGSNGVILITTKKGKAGKTLIKASSEIGYNSFVNTPKNSRPLQAADWLAMLKEGLTNAGIAPATITSTLHSYGDTSNINTDWFSLLTRTGQQQQYNISASGGSEKTTFYSSVGYFNQEASLLASSLKRFSGAIDVRNQATKNLVFDLSISGSYQNQNSPLGGSAFSNPVMGIYFLRPTQNPFNADGTLNILRTSPLNFSTGVTHNPLYTLSHNVYNTRTTQFKPILSAEYILAKGLKYSGKYGIDYNNLEEFKYYNPNNGDGVSVNGSGSALYTRYFLQDFTNQLDYHVGFLSDRSLTADFKVGYENVNSKYFGITASANTYSNDKLLDLVNASVFSTANSNQSDYRFVSTFSNAVINYKNRYVVTGSFRRDGSSRFGPNNKFGNFYAVGASWNASEEAFFKNQKTVSFLKIRGSYGLSGNAEIGNYTATAQQNSGYNYGGAAGTAFETIGNESLSWEKTTQLDLGVDIGFFKDRLNFTFDYYDKKSDGLLYSAPVSLSTGFATKLSNIGAITNKGIELTVNATPVLTKDFRWDVSVNFTHNTNKVTAMPNNNADVVSGLFRIRVGEDYRNYYTYDWAGVDPANGDPLWYADTARTTKTNDYSKAVKINLNKSASPKYYGGFSNTFTYKGFGLTTDFTYNFGNYVYDSWSNYFSDGQYALSYGKYAYNLDRWTTPGQITNVPKYTYNSANKSNSTSSRFLYKGDYIRLRNIEFSYTATKTLLEKLKVNSVRFYVRGSNWFTKSYDKNLPFDPEQGINGGSNLTIFMSKATTVGLTIGL